MKRNFSYLMLSLVTLLMVTSCHKRPEPKEFSPKQFQADLEQYVVGHSDFTEEEAKNFIPLFREMREKMFRCFKTEQKTMKIKPESPEDWARILGMLDSLGVEKAKIQMEYHQKMLKSIPAEKIMESVRAEDDFLRESIHNMKADRHQPEDLDKAPGPEGPRHDGPRGPHGPQDPHGGPHPHGQHGPHGPQ